MAEWSWRGTRAAPLRELVIPLIVLTVLVVSDALLPLSSQITGSFSLAAVLAALRSGPARTAVVAVLATVLAALAGSWDGNAGSQAWSLRLLVSAVISTAAVIIAADRESREQRLRRLTVVAEAAAGGPARAADIGRPDRARRPLPVGRGRRAHRGDLYEVSATPFGVRIIVGDVRERGWTPSSSRQPSSGRSARRR
jgi:sigma-B regulation protein RsbU (phosphoserine phosphatase)